MCLPGESGRKSMAAHHHCRRFQGVRRAYQMQLERRRLCGSADYERFRQRLSVVKGLAICPALCGLGLVEDVAAQEELLS